jgi:hypothetical protein
VTTLLGITVALVSLMLARAVRRRQRAAHFRRLHAAAYREPIAAWRREAATR